MADLLVGDTLTDEWLTALTHPRVHRRGVFGLGTQVLPG